jgi:phosphoserine phosphatase RsbX
MEALARSAIESGVAAAASPGQSHCGDVAVLMSLPDGFLVAALDGLGHGEGAASAARIASAILEEHAGEPLVSLIDRCHQELRATRGVVMSVGWFDLPEGPLTWLGVGNVQGVLVRGLALDAVEEALLLRAGVVGGAHLPHLQAAVLPVSAGDTLVFATDGVAADFSRGLARSLPPQRAAEAILGRHRRAKDDALVVVARFLGGGA